MRHILALVGSCLVLSCGGSKAPAAESHPPSSGGSKSKLSLVVKEGKFESTGRAFAWQEGGDALSVAVISDDSAPTPTCDNAQIFGGVMSKGKYLSAKTSGFKGTPGAVEVVGVGFLIDDGQGNGSMGVHAGLGEASPLGSTFTITKLTKDSLEGAIVAKPGGPASGEIHATLCAPIPAPAASFTAPAANDEPIAESLKGPDPAVPKLAKGESYISLSAVGFMGNARHVDLKGTGIALLERGGGRDRLSVGVYEPGTTPTPDCSNIVDYTSGMMSVKKGRFVGVSARIAEKMKTHDVDVIGLDVVPDPAHNASTGDENIRDYTPSTFLEIVKLTDTSAEVKISSRPTGGAKGRASGTIVAKLCVKSL